MKSALTAMLSVDPLAYIEVIIDNINDFDGADSEERRAAVWDFVLTDLRNALMELFMQPNAATVERTFIDGVQKVSCHRRRRQPTESNGSNSAHPS